MTGTDDNTNWRDEDVVIPPQGETVVYRNEKNATVIRQRDPFLGDEETIVIQPEFLPALIQRLQQHHAENRRGEIPE